MAMITGRIFQGVGQNNCCSEALVLIYRSSPYYNIIGNYNLNISNPKYVRVRHNLVKGVSQHWNLWGATKLHISRFSKTQGTVHSTFKLFKGVCINIRLYEIIIRQR